MSLVDDGGPRDPSLSTKLYGFYWYSSAFQPGTEPSDESSLQVLRLTSPASRTILGTELRVTFHLDSSSKAGNGAAVPSCSSSPGAAFPLGEPPRSLCFLPPPRTATKASRVWPSASRDA